VRVAGFQRKGNRHIFLDGRQILAQKCRVFALNQLFLISTFYFINMGIKIRHRLVILEQLGRCFVADTFYTRNIVGCIPN
jgi:hypothetical protein